MQLWHRRVWDGRLQREKILRDNNRKGADQHGVRESNRSLILNYIRARNTVPRSDLAPYTGLSRTAIGNIVDELVQEGIIRQEENRTGEDRRTTLLSFNATAGYVLGGTLGRQHLSVVLADLTGQPIQRLDIPFSLSKGPKEGLPLLERFLKVFVAEQQISWEMIIGIGLGITNPLDLFMQKTTLVSPFPGWPGVDIHHTLKHDL